MNKRTTSTVSPVTISPATNLTDAVFFLLGDYNASGWQTTAARYGHLTHQPSIAIAAQSNTHNALLIVLDRENQGEYAELREHSEVCAEERALPLVVFFEEYHGDESVRDGLVIHFGPCDEDGQRPVIAAWGATPDAAVAFTKSL